MDDTNVGVPVSDGENLESKVAPTNGVMKAKGLQLASQSKVKFSPEPDVVKAEIQRLDYIPWHTDQDYLPENERNRFHPSDSGASGNAKFYIIYFVENDYKNKVVRGHVSNSGKAMSAKNILTALREYKPLKMESHPFIYERAVGGVKEIKQAELRKQVTSSTK